MARGSRCAGFDSARGRFAAPLFLNGFVVPLKGSFPLKRRSCFQGRTQHSGYSPLRKKADACRHQPGEVGALLRREGVYSSTLSQWRRQKDEGTLAALKPKRRGRKVQEVNPLAGRVTELEREVQRLQGKLRQAETIIDVQKKLCEMV